MAGGLQGLDLAAERRDFSLFVIVVGFKFGNIVVVGDKEGIQFLTALIRGMTR